MNSCHRIKAGKPLKGSSSVDLHFERRKREPQREKGVARGHITIWYDLAIPAPVLVLRFTEEPRGAAAWPRSHSESMAELSPMPRLSCCHRQTGLKFLKTITSHYLQLQSPIICWILPLTNNLLLHPSFAPCTGAIQSNSGMTTEV